MLCDRVLGNIADDPQRWKRRGVDWVEFAWHQCARRAVRKQTRLGHAMRILLPLGVTLRHGDVLHESGGDGGDGGPVIAVEVQLIEVLVVRPRGVAEAARLCIEIGNLHAPAQVTPDALLLLPDGPVMEVLHHLDLPHDRQRRRFVPTPLQSAPAVRLAPGFRVQ